MLALPMLGRPRRHGGSGLSDKERAAFAESIKQLVATGRVWCVATLRADPYELLLNEPVLKALKEAGASLQSRAAGEQGSSPKSSGRRPRPQELVFEGDTAHGELDERLLADPKGADSLPLLQFTLRQL
jgi:eukaryotic-like serine/threonine-protein kinase